MLSFAGDFSRSLGFVVVFVRKMLLLRPRYIYVDSVHLSFEDLNRDDRERGMYFESLDCLATMMIGASRDIMKQIGETVVPAGAPGLTGRRVAECFLDFAARMAIAEKPGQRSTGEVSRYQRVFPLKQVYKGMVRSNRLIDYLGEPDDIFVGLDSDSELKDWARARLNRV